MKNKKNIYNIRNLQAQKKVIQQKRQIKRIVKDKKSVNDIKDNILHDLNIAIIDFIEKSKNENKDITIELINQFIQEWFVNTGNEINQVKEKFNISKADDNTKQFFDIMDITLNVLNEKLLKDENFIDYIEKLVEENSSKDDKKEVEQ